MTLSRGVAAIVALTLVVFVGAVAIREARSTRAIGGARLGVPTVHRVGSVQEIAPRSWVMDGDPCVLHAALPELAGLSERSLLRVAAELHAPVVVYEGERQLSRTLPSGPSRPCAGYATFSINTVNARRTVASTEMPRVALDPSVPIRIEGSADAYWVYPGTALEWSFAKPFGNGPVAVDVAILAVAGGQGSPSVHVGAAQTTFSSEGQARSARVTTPKLTGPWAVTVASPADGPFVVVRALRVRAEADEVVILHEPETRWVDLLVGASFSGPLVDPVPVAGITEEGGQYVVAAPWPNNVGCSPVTLFENARAFTHPAGESSSARPLLAGHASHVADWLRFLPSDVSDPRSNGRSYTTALREDRACWVPRCARCESRRWIYPNDTLTIVANAAMRNHLGGALAQIGLRVSANVAPPSGAALSVEIRHGGAATVTDVSLNDLSAEFALPLATPILPEDPVPLELVIRSSADLPPLLVSVTGTEQ